jgi:hypothetical protein
VIPLLAAALLAQDAEFFPLKPGSEWTYTLSNGLTMGVKVTGAGRVKGVECAVVETSANGQATREHLALTAEGLQAFRMENASGAMEFETPVLRAKLPVRKGDEWKVVLKEGFGENTYRYRCEGTEQVTVAAGTFEALKIVTTLETVQGRMTTTLWYGRGIGVLKQAMTLGHQSLTAELTATNLKAAPAPAPAAGGSMVRYESKDARVLLFHPPGWKVADGEQFGPGTYSVSVGAPDESAGVLFMTFALNEQAPDSVALANLILGNLRKTYADFTVADMRSAKDRTRTTASAAYTEQPGKKVSGRLHFFHTGRAGTVYALLAREDLWEKLRPTLVQVVANLAYAPEGAVKVLRQGQETASAPRPEGRIENPAWIVKEAHARAAKGEGAEIALQPVVAQDQSFSLQVPRGWTFLGSQLQWSVVDDPRANSRGASALMYTVFVPGGFAVQQPGMLISPYLPPAQALAFLLQKSGLGGNLRILSATTVLELDPGYAQKVWKPALAAGAQVDNRLMLVEFTNAATGAASRGVFSVTSTAWPLGTSWTVNVEGCWAPSGELDRLLPAFARVTSSIEQNGHWVRQKFADQAAESRRLNQNLMKSIGEMNQAFDRYNQGWWESQKSRDYTSWAWSQTTLGQGSWISEREGAEVVRSSSWGLENVQTGDRTNAWNRTNFTGRNPWSGEQLNEVDTRSEYERYIRGR